MYALKKPRTGESFLREVSKPDNGRCVTSEKLELPETELTGKKGKRAKKVKKIRLLIDGLFISMPTYLEFKSALSAALTPLP